MKALVVEDDRYTGQLLSEMLQDRGFEVELAGSVQAALEYRLEDYSVLIIDVMLPNDPEVTGISIEESRGGYLSGVAFARRVRQRHPSARIVLLTSAMEITGAEDWANSHDVPFVRKIDGPQALFAVLEKLRVLPNLPTPKAFIVHGRDEQALGELKEYIKRNLKWQAPVVLREQPSAGKTVIEKFEEFASRADCVFVLLTPDDLAGDEGDKRDDDSKRRSRQNVIFELGFFYAQFRRLSGRDLLLQKGPIEIPSDLQGIVWIDVKDGILASGELIRKEVGQFTVDRDPPE